MENQSPFPEINLGIVDSLKDHAKRIGHFLFHTPEAPLYLSNHYEKSHFEPTDGEAHQPQLPFQEGFDANGDFVVKDKS